MRRPPRGDRATIPGARRVGLALTVVVLGLLPLLGLPAGAALAQEPSAAQRLAEQYAPIAYLRTQAKACDKDAEGYFPAPVELVLGNPEVALKRRTGNSSAEDTVVKMGPTAPDLVGLDEDHYLDFPGNPRRAGCTYETDFKRFAAASGAQPTTYARIVVDAEEEKLVLQYWFWFYFNDWNNTHETDWEMVQLVFDATSAEEALGQEPSLVGYAQHGGGERAEWTDAKVLREEGRPLVFPGAGSHGTYYGREVYIGWGENGTGFGCDDTTAPLTRTPLEVVLIPDNPGFDSPFAWVYYDGRWGERQTWEFNGPKGPNMGGKWRDPYGAMENWREYSLSIPSSRSLGPTATDVFCTLSEAGSKILIEFGTRPWLLLTGIVALLAVVVALFAIKMRDVKEAFGVYRRHLSIFAVIGLLTIPIGIAFNGFALLINDNPPMEWLVEWFNDSAGSRLLASLVVNGAQTAGMALVVAPPVIQAMEDLREGRRPGVRSSFRKAYRWIWPLLAAFFLFVFGLMFWFLFLLGIPVAIWLAVRWQFFGQAVILDEAPSGPAALRRSSAAVRGRWWQALGNTIAFQLLVVLPGPLIGVALLLFGKTGVRFANGVSSLVYAVTVPIAVIGFTLAYERFRARRTAEASTPTDAGPAPGPAPA